MIPLLCSENPADLYVHEQYHKQKTYYDRLKIPFNNRQEKEIDGNVLAAL